MRRSKYNAVRTTVNGLAFASKREAHRYMELLLLQRLGEIHALELQPRYELHAFGSGARKVGEWRGDFRYCTCPRKGGKCWSTEIIVEDAKGFKTPLYKWKKKHVEAQYGIEIREV